MRDYGLTATSGAVQLADQVLRQSDKSLILRRFTSAGSIIVKRFLGPGAALRVRHETAMLERVSSAPGVVQLARAFVSADSIALVDTFGAPLAAVARSQAFGLAELLDFALELARTLAAIHRVGVVHRDINPANILLVGADRRPLLIEFHLASSSAQERPAFTPEGEIEGRLAYIAPEQTGRTGRVLDHRADLYAFGAILYELATGQPPFESIDFFQIIRDLLVKVAPPPSVLNPELPPAFSDMIVRLLQKEPDQRYQSAEGIASDLSVLIERLSRGDNRPFRLGENDFSGRLAPPSRLIGREPEISELQAAFDDALVGRRNAVFIAGGPGSGKTALCNELRSIVAATGGWFVMGKHDRVRQEFDADGIARAFRQLFRLLLAEPEEALVPLRRELELAAGPYLALGIALIPEFALLMQMVPALVLIDPAEAQGHLTQLVLELLRTIARKRPIVFAVDDIQWATVAGVALFDKIVSETIPGLLLVGAYRVADVDSAHPLHAMVARWESSNAPPRAVFLADLERQGLSDLLVEMLRLARTDALRLADAVAARTGGNPYDTIELINALRRDGVLNHGAGGWTWDDVAVRRYVGDGDLLALFNARIDGLPDGSKALLEILACLGGVVPCALLEAAGGLSALELENRMGPVLDDGLIVLERGDVPEVRFRHDRVAQTALSRLALPARIALHCAIARRLEKVFAFESIAAEQYLPALEVIDAGSEKLRCVGLFRAAAAQARLVANDAAVQRLLAAAVTLLSGLGEQGDALAADLENEMHAALCRLGRLDEADVIYASIAQRGGDPLQTIESACTQISSLTNQSRLNDALTLGLDLLARIGFVAPPAAEIDASVRLRLGEITRWCDAQDARRPDEQRTEASEPRAIGAAALITRMMPTAYYHDHTILAWLVFESLRLWSEHGPQAGLVGALSHAGFVSIGQTGDYITGYRAVRRVLQSSEARGYEPQTSHSRFLFAFSAQHWFEPFRDSVVEARRAHVGLLEGGNLQSACYTYAASIPLLLQCSISLDEYAAEIQAAFAFCSRTGNEQSAKSHLAHRQLAKSLRGDTIADGSFTDDTFDESTHVAGLDRNPTGAVNFHTARALGAYIFNQTPELLRHTDAAMPLLPVISGNPVTAIAHVLRAVAMARRVASAQSADRSTLLIELDASLEWLRLRAGDARANFLHSLRLVEAERAWALSDFLQASEAFEAALRAVAGYESPLHQALVMERAGLFYLDCGLERYGRLLLIDARQSYDNWGAIAKVRRLEADHPALFDGRVVSERRAAMTTTVSADAIDMVGILQASQALSSETNVQRLKERVTEWLAGLTGATAVLLVVRPDETQEWFFSAAGDANAASIPVNEAGARGLLPLTAFRYVERTHEQLLLKDATRDDRFARDPYFADCEQCSMLVVPILSQGAPRAILLLENRLGKDAFSGGRLDAVMLIAGQLAVSLDNALLYASLERKVAERTAALALANEQLAHLSLTDALTGLVNRRGFDEQLAAHWRRALRTQTSVGLAMIDVDQFKSYNDLYGHAAGDACLARLARMLKAGVRPDCDLAARYGGEEFVLILPDTGLAGIAAAAERLRADVAALGVAHAAAAHGIVTISIGVVAFVPSPDRNAAHYLEAADSALYEAKDNGRNRVERAVDSRS